MIFKIIVFDVYSYNKYIFKYIHSLLSLFNLSLIQKWEIKIEMSQCSPSAWIIDSSNSSNSNSMHIMCIK